MEIGERILMICVGLVFMIGSVKFIMLGLESQRAAMSVLALGLIGFFYGVCIFVWAFTGPPG